LSGGGKVFAVNGSAIVNWGMRPAHLLLVIALLSASCAPRQARVETDPRGGEAARRQLEELARNDLDALKRAEAAHFADAGAYTYDADTLGFSASPGIKVSVLEASDGGFSALAQGGSIECAIFVGTADPPRSYARTAAVVSCRS